MKNIYVNKNESESMSYSYALVGYGSFFELFFCKRCLILYKCRFLKVDKRPFSIQFVLSRRIRSYWCAKNNSEIIVRRLMIWELNKKCFPGEVHSSRTKVGRILSKSLSQASRISYTVSYIQSIICNLETILI